MRKWSEKRWYERFQMKREGKSKSLEERRIKIIAVGKLRTQRVHSFADTQTERWGKREKNNEQNSLQFIVKVEIRHLLKCWHLFCLECTIFVGKESSFSHRISNTCKRELIYVEMGSEKRWEKKLKSIPASSIMW